MVYWMVWVMPCRGGLDIRSAESVLGVDGMPVLIGAGTDGASVNVGEWWNEQGGSFGLGALLTGWNWHARMHAFTSPLFSDIMGYMWSKNCLHNLVALGVYSVGSKYENFWLKFQGELSPRNRPI